MKKILTTTLIIISLLMLNVRVGFAQVPAQTTSNTSNTLPAVKLDDKARKVKRTVEKIGVAGKLTLYLKNGEQLYGNVVRYDAESVEVTEVDLKKVVTVQYVNIKKVREGYGNPSPFTGKRNIPAKGIRMGVAIGLLFLAIGLPIIAIASSKD